MIEEATSPGIQKLEQVPAVPGVPAALCESGVDADGIARAEAPGERPLDLVDYDEAALMVDRHRNRIRAWVREGQLRSWSAEPDRPNAKRLVSRSELMRLVVVTGKSAHPGGPGRGDPAEPSTPAEHHPSGPAVPLPISEPPAEPVAPLQAVSPQVSPPQVVPPQVSPPQAVLPQVSPPQAVVRAAESVALAHVRLDAERAKVGMLEALVQAERQRAEALERALQAERERAEAERLRGADWRDRATALQAEVEALRAERGLPWWRKLLTG